jgi:hypothetical protein
MMTRIDKQGGQMSVRQSQHCSMEQVRGDHCAYQEAYVHQLLYRSCFRLGGSSQLAEGCSAGHALVILWACGREVDAEGCTRAQCH